MEQSRATLAAIAFFAILFAAMIGCGGGGGGGTSTGTTSTSTSSTSTTSTTSSTSTTGGTTTAATTGTAGDFPPNVIFFSQNLGASDTIEQMNPDGSGVTTFDTLPTNYSGYAPSPADTKVAFGYSSTGTVSPQFAIYVNTSVNVTGATVVDAGPFVFVGSLQFTPDGSKMIYVAQTISGSSGVFIANTNGTGSPVRLDDADDAALSPSGTVVVYTRATTGNGEICRRNTDGTGFFQITTNSSEDILPQWTKEGDRIYFSSNRSGHFNIWSMDPSGANVQRVTNDTDGDYGSSPNTGNTLVTFSKIASNPSLTGVYRTGPTGGAVTSLFVSPDIDAFVYWTGTNGRAVGGGTGAPGGGLSPREQRLLRRRR